MGNSRQLKILSNKLLEFEWKYSSGDTRNIKISRMIQLVEKILHFWVDKKYQVQV